MAKIKLEIRAARLMIAKELRAIGFSCWCDDYKGHRLHISIGQGDYRSVLVRRAFLFAHEGILYTIPSEHDGYRTLFNFKWERPTMLEDIIATVRYELKYQVKSMTSSIRVCEKALEKCQLFKASGIKKRPWWVGLSRSQILDRMSS